ncbi:MAG: hypothetical protein Q4B77_07405 [Coriobacteriaceae bacterium]|nr:hypothetical protein [Coriobacteriaceae bacterium]
MTCTHAAHEAGNGEAVVHLVLVNCDGCDAALELLADDLEEALGVYERFAADDPSKVRKFQILRFEPSHIDGVQPGSRVYAIACTSDCRAERATYGLLELERLCERRELVWSGGVAVGGGRLVRPCAQGPRMGRMRRSRSEAIDQLILAMRSNCSVCALPNAPANGVIVARSPVPSFAYDWAVELFENMHRRQLDA